MIPNGLNKSSWFKFFYDASSLSIAFVCTVFIFLVMAIDWLTGPILSTSIFYLLPISLAAWFVNRQAGLAFSLASASLWFFTDYFTNPNLNGQMIFWNASVRLGFFLIVVFSLTALRRSRERQDDLMAFVVHDLRAPLGNMLTALDMLQTWDAEQEDDMWDELITLGMSSGQRLLVLVNSLLDLSRLESGKLQFQKEAIPPARLLEDSLSQVVLTAKFKKVNIETEIDQAITDVFADHETTQRVLVNLLNNAIKFSPEESVIKLKAILANGGEIIFSVQDKGQGIPLEWQRRVFAKYDQVSGGKTGGSGLGLTFCKLAVEAQGGRIWLESEPDAGTTLLFSLPAASGHLPRPKDRINDFG